MSNLMVTGILLSGFKMENNLCECIIREAAVNDNACQVRYFNEDYLKDYYIIGNILYAEPESK